MRRLWVTFVAVAAILAACGSTTAPAATVNDVDISMDDLEAELSAYVDNPALETRRAQFLGSTEDSYQMGFTVEILAQLVFRQLSEQGLAELEIEVTDDHLAQAQELLEQSPPETREIIAQFPAEIRDRIIRDVAIDVAISEALVELPDGDDAERRFFEENRELFDLDRTCSRHILVDTEAEAEDVIDDLEDGDEFAELAAEVSTDTGSGLNGGELGCNPAGQFVPEFEAAVESAEIGEIVGPVQTQFGFHVIEVTDRFEASFDDVALEVRQVIVQRQQSARGEFYRALFAEADIELNPRFGVDIVFDEASGRVRIAGPQGPLAPDLDLNF